MKLPKKVDFLVVGAGLVGLHFYNKLKSEGKNAILIEKTGELGGSLLHPKDEVSFKLESLLWTVECKPSLFKYEKEFSDCLGLGKKGLMPFVGFGEDKVSALELVDLFADPKTNIVTGLNLDPVDLKGVHTHTQITSMYKNDGELYNFFEINGKNTIEAQNVIWTSPVQELEYILPKDSFGSLRQKIKKAKDFDAITARFQLAHEELGAHQNSKFVFIGEENTPWIGCPVFEDQLTFVSYFDGALSHDHDFIRKHLKTLKRRILKALPDALSEDQWSEKITLHKSAVSSFNPGVKDGRLKELPNFFLLSSHKNFWPYPVETKINLDLNL